MRAALALLVACSAIDASAGCLDGPDPIASLPSGQVALLNVGAVTSEVEGKPNPVVVLRAQLTIKRGESWLSTREAAYELTREELQEKIADARERLVAAADPDLRNDIRFEIEDLRAQLTDLREDYRADRESCQGDLETLRGALATYQARGGQFRCVQRKVGFEIVTECK